MTCRWFFYFMDLIGFTALSILQNKKSPEGKPPGLFYLVICDLLVDLDNKNS
jgi:hypothetical protein